MWKRMGIWVAGTVAMLLTVSLLYPQLTAQVLSHATPDISLFANWLATHVMGTGADGVAMAGAALVASREKLKAKQGELAKVFEEAGADLDFEKVKCLDGTTADKAARVKAMNDELADLQRQTEELAGLEDIKARTEALGQQLAGDGKGRPPAPAPMAHADPSQAPTKSIGQLITEHQAFQLYRKTRSPQVGVIEDGFGLAQLKTLFQTTAGWAPEVTRIPGLVIEGATRPIQILDIIPQGQTDQSSVAYMEETTRTHAAAEKAEAAAYAESTFALTEVTSAVRKITDSLPVTDEQLDDVAGVRSYIDNRLNFGLRQRLDGQLLTGNGTPPNLEGILNKSGIQTQAKGADPTFDALHKAITKVLVTGRAFPSAIVMHPNDWEALRLTRTADGIYILGNPADAMTPRIWGLSVVVSDAITENTGLVGDFRNFCQLYERKGVDIQVGYVNDDFAKGKKTIRADLRVAFAIYRAAAFCTVTGI